ncbi:MAG: ubiquinol-cytochrome c reductase iron-sulfur subunit [Myxococcota bacterium]
MISRRALVAGSVAFAACGTVTTPVVEAGAPEGEGWEAFALADYPALLEPGGAAAVQRPEALIDVWVLHLASGAWAAVWKVCTHGACEVAPRGEQLECPCHGSVFSSDGAVLRGPATRPLARFEAVRSGDRLYLRRA